MCLTPGTNSNCPIKTNCEAKETFCKTLLSTNSTGHESEYKSCAVNCKEGPVFSSSIGSLDISCCRTDLCNISGAPGGTCSSALLSLALALISLYLRNISL
ncbi:hypothetical protein XELAEV_18034077mg [Xenopus laevis]|nr:hypothetical protein XELAEV_18034077mg [Xenopus laevis]